MSTQLSNSGGGAYDPRYFSKSTHVDGGKAQRDHVLALNIEDL